ncbi:PREDICTED: odorant receptor 13a-like, partial [Polistes dominula]|uniref:Odorant receptor n=1 Tax=Polistes dominula TaxID=743375 RepID=A0ABM1IGH9_POLDO
LVNVIIFNIISTFTFSICNKKESYRNKCKSRSFKRGKTCTYLTLPKVDNSKLKIQTRKRNLQQLAQTNHHHLHHQSYCINVQRFFFICGALMYGSGILFRGIIPLTRGKIIINENITIRPLPCPCYYLFFDPQISPVYEIVYFLQCLSGIITYSITTAVCGLAALFVLHICGQLEILTMLMKRMVEKTDVPGVNIDAKIATTVEHQIRVRNFLRMVEHMLQKLCLIELTGCTLILCCLSYNIMMEWTSHNLVIVFMYSIALSSIICNIFMFCYIGEQLTFQAENVAKTCRTLDWYNLPKNKSAGVILMTAISNRPMRITAGNIVGLSLQTFGNVIKTAATYCNMLRAVTT